MKKHWEKRNLGEVCSFVRGPFGGSLKKNCFVDDGYAVYEQQHAIYNQFDEIRYFINESKFKEMQRFQLFSGDLIMSCSGTMGRVAIVPEGIKKGVINQALLKLTPKKNLDIQFLKYWMDSEDFKISILKHSKGAAIKNVASVQILKSISFPIPSLPEQQQIVSILDEAFAAIDKAKENVQRNLQNTKELFQSELNSIFSKKGDGWVEKKLGECFKLKSGDGLIAKNMNLGIYSVYGGNGIAGTHDKFNLSGENIIVGRVGALCGNVRFIQEKIWLTDNAFQIVEFQFKFDYSFLTYLLNFKDLRSAARQSAQPVISNSSLKDMLLQFPINIKTQQQIVHQLDTLSSETKKLEIKYQQKLNTLEELKKSILQKAFSGELTKTNCLA